MSLHSLYSLPQNLSRVQKNVLAVAGLIALAVVLECFVFNFQFWQTRDLASIQLAGQPIIVDSDEDSVTFENLDIAAQTISFTIDVPDDTAVYVQASISDTGFSQPYTLPRYEIDGSDEFVGMIHPYGTIHSLTLSFPGAADVYDWPVTYPITIEQVSLNAAVPFQFNLLRFAIVLCVLLVLYAFRPTSALYHMPAFGADALARGLRAAVCIVLCAAFMGTLALHRGIGGAVVSNEQSSIEASDEYAALARSFTQGNLFISQNPPAYLSEMNNPYDEQARDDAAKQTGESWKRDVSYYNGHYYVYYGVVPAVALYLPFYLATGSDLPNAIPIALFGVASIIGLCMLLKSIARRRFSSVSLGSYLLITLGLVTSTCLIYVATSPTFYQIPQIAAICFALWGLWFWHEGYMRKSAFRIALGSLCLALVIGCRPQIGCLLLLAVPLGVAIGRNQDIGRKRAFIGALAVPIVVVAALIMWYNCARFASPFDFGANYNLASNDMTARGFSVQRSFDALFSYLVQPPSITGTAPFLQWIDPSVDSSYHGMTVAEPMFGGVLALFPFLIAILLGRKKYVEDRPTRYLIVFLAACAFAVCVVDTQGAGILGRYIEDFAFMFSMAASLVWLSLLNSQAGPGEANTALKATIVIGVSFCALLFLAELRPSSGYNVDAWQTAQSIVQFWG